MEGLQISRNCLPYEFIIGNSRYMKAARCLLEEVIDVGGREMDLCNEILIDKMFPGRRRADFGLSSEIKAELIGPGLMSLPEKHELQIRVAKLVGLLEQVEEGYEKYCNQLEQVVSSFEEIAGTGSAKPYTSLALQAMTRHFRILQDAIISQINTIGRKFPQDHLPRISSSLSQLSLFDRYATRHCSTKGVSCLQQMGLRQGQHGPAWRSIRGLPDSSVAILRAWLFEHFLHPYPNESEKLMLASQTGLSKNQVSNWFINARVRLWKPMIEEMHRAEFADESSQSLDKDREEVADDNVEDRADKSVIC